MNTPTSPVRRLHALEIAARAYLFFAIGRSFYEVGNLGSLYGWLADGQLRLLGHFGFKTTFALTFGVYLLPFLAAVRYSAQATAAKVFACMGVGVALAGAAVYFVLEFDGS